MPEAPARPGVAVIGAGAVGSALARRLAARGYPIRAVISRTRSRAGALADAVGAPVASNDVEALPEGTGLVVACVPDDALTPLAEALHALGRDWHGHIATHTSGARTSRVWAPLVAQGAEGLSLHPLQTLPPGAGPDAFEGAYASLEGTPAALPVGRRVARDLGLRPVVVPADAKTRVHLAATLASNAFVTLLAIADEVLSTTGLDRAEAYAMLQPLVETTWRNLQAARPEDVLTGPIARGDAQTVARHLEALLYHLPHLAPVYGALANETVRVALRSDRLAPSQAPDVLAVIHEALEGP